jgi:hypothetical protein
MILKAITPTWERNNRVGGTRLGAGPWSDLLGNLQHRRTTSFVIVYALSSFTSIGDHHIRPRVVVMLSAVSPSESSIASDECWAKTPGACQSFETC